jgi:hypothetical protein
VFFFRQISKFCYSGFGFVIKAKVSGQINEKFNRKYSRRPTSSKHDFVRRVYEGKQRRGNFL